MARAVRTAADLGASVINISSVACVAVASALDDRALGAALAYAVDVKNAVIVAAAGNTGGAAQCPPQRPDATWETVTVAVSPAWYDDYVLTVGSVNAEGTPSAFTLAGPWVDVAADRRGGDFARFGIAVRHELRRAGRQWVGRADPGPVPGVDRTAGDAAHRVDRASPARRMGSGRRQRHDRCPGRGQHRRGSAGQHRQTSARAGADQSLLRHPRRRIVTAAAPPCAARRSALVALVASPCHRRGAGAGYGGPATVSRATDAFCLLSSGPDGKAANIGHGAGSRRRQPEVVCRVVVVDREPHSGVGDEVSRAGAAIAPHVGASAGRQVDRVQRGTAAVGLRQGHRHLTRRHRQPVPRQESDVGMPGCGPPKSRTQVLPSAAVRCRRAVGEAGDRQRVHDPGASRIASGATAMMLAVPCELLKRSRSAATWPIRCTPAANTT